MHPLSDKDLDRLSREAAEQYDVEQNTSGWDKLEQKLSKHMPEKGKKERRRFLFFIWIFTLLSGGGLLWMLTGSNPQFITLKEGSSKPNLPIAPEQSTTQSTQDDQKSFDKMRVDVPVATNPAENTAINKTTEGPNGSDLSKSPSRSPGDKQVSDRRGLTAGQVVSRNQSGIRANTPDAPQKYAGPNSSRQSEHQVIREKDDIKETVPASERKENNKTPPAIPVQPPVNTADANKVTGDQNKVTPDETPQAPAQQANPATSKKKTSMPRTGSWFRPGLEIGLVGAPDMSNVRFTNTDKIGFNAGIQLGYRFSNRLTVNTGVLYTRKNYTAEGRDFSPPRGTWLDNVKLDAVEGYCYMFDIPLNIRYDLTTGNKHRYFVNTGVSSYLMKKEDYHYYYQYTNGTPGYRHRSGKSTEQHLASIVNISAGIEKKLGKHLSVQGEPFLKIPLTGLGYGNLKLNSYGVYFSVKYHTR